MKVVDVHPSLLSVIESLQDKIVLLEKQLEQEGKAYEIQQEQLSFADDLIRNLLHVIDNGSNLRQVKKDIKVVVENSYYEL